MTLFFRAHYLSPTEHIRSQITNGSWARRPNDVCIENTMQMLLLFIKTKRECAHGFLERAD